MDIDEFIRRRDYANQFGWSVPSKEAIEKIKEFVGNESVLEVGAGRGLWAKLMQDAGISVVPTDYFVSHGIEKEKNPRTFTEVEKLKHLDAVNKYGDNKVLMLSWPPYNDPMAYETLKNFNGDKLIYIGEGVGGCTADDQFCKLLNELWQEIEIIDIPQWSGIHDYLTLYVRK